MKLGDSKNWLSILRQMNSFFNGIPVTKDNLVSTVQNVVSKKAGRPVFVKADEKVNYGAVMHVVNTLKMVGGIEYVGMATKRA